MNDLMNIMRGNPHERPYECPPGSLYERPFMEAPMNALMNIQKEALMNAPPYGSPY